MDNSELEKILEAHKRWLETNGKEGERANLRHADLRDAFLRTEDLRYANLEEADLRGANLYGANLYGGDLQGTNLSNADLRGVDLCHANLEEADLRGADLRGAYMDYSCWPLWCGSLEVKIDKRIACQLLYHALRAMQSVDDEECRAVCRDPKVIALANKFHRAKECGEIHNEETSK